ncbi:RNA-directed DNA polymerase, eukaryota, reverse transcriptase zinc-binding domain protein, partial [Tanacetum coccineum]
MWNKFVFLDLMKNNGGVFFCKFHDEHGMEEVVNNGPWLVYNKPMFVQKWRVGMVLDKAEPRKLPIWVKIINVPMEAWSVKRISALASSLGKPIIMDEMTARMCEKGEGRLSFARVLIEIEAGKPMKEEIKVIYKGSTCHEKFSKKIQVEYAWKPPCCDKCQVFGHDTSRCGYKEKEIQRMANENDYKKKQGNTMENTNEKHKEKDDSMEKCNEKQKDNMDKAREGSSSKVNDKDNVIKENDKEIMEKRSSYNRFTLLNDLVGEDELIPPIEQRKIVDEYMNQEHEGNMVENQGWNMEMKKYYKDRKELFDEARDMELEEDVENEMHNKEESGLGNENIGKDGNILVTSDKQKEVRKLIKEENLQLCSIIETHIRYQNIMKVSKRVFDNWEFSSNGKDNGKGCRIMVSWNSNKLKVWVIAKSKQFMFILVETICLKIRFYCTIVYASNSYNERRKLWKELDNQKIIASDDPWVVIGDFNVTLKVEEHSNGSSVPSVVPKLGSYALGYKVIVILDKHKVTMRETLLMSFTKGYAESNLYSGKSSSSGNLGSGRDTLTVGKISSSGNHITSSGNALAFYSQQNLSIFDTKLA